MEYEVPRKKAKRSKRKDKKPKAKKAKKTRSKKGGLSADARGLLQYLEGGGAVISRNYPSQGVPAVPPQAQARELAVRLQLPNTQMAGLMRQMLVGRPQLPRQMGQQTSQLFRDQTYQQALDLKNQIQAEKTERLRLETKVANDELAFRQALTNSETRANTLMNQLQNTQRAMGGGGGSVAPSPRVAPRMPSFGDFIPSNPYFSRANSVAGEGLDVAFLAESESEMEREMSPPELSPRLMSPPPRRAMAGGGVPIPLPPVSESESSGEYIDPRQLSRVLEATGSPQSVFDPVAMGAMDYVNRAPTGRVVLPDKPYAEGRSRRRSARQPKPNPRFAEGVQAPFGGVDVRIPDLRRQIAEITGVSERRIKIERTGRGARAELASLREEVSAFPSRGLQGGSAIEALKNRQRVRFAED